MQEFLFETENMPNFGKDFKPQKMELPKGYIDIFTYDNDTGRQSRDLQIYKMSQNYLYYLEDCWKNHFGIIIRPDFLWNMILSEMSYLVNQNPDDYRSLFTQFDDKQEISIQQADPFIMDLSLLKKELSKQILFDANVLFPKFEDQTVASQYNQYLIFAEMASPYYDYSIKLCGFNGIRVYGERHEWMMMKANIINLRKIFKQSDDMKIYLNKILKILKRILKHFKEPEFWNGIFKKTKCGSGTYEVDGWILEFYETIPDVRKTHNFNLHNSSIEYKSKTLRKKFVLYSGMIYYSVKQSFYAPSKEMDDTISESEQKYFFLYPEYFFGLKDLGSYEN